MEVQKQVRDIIGDSLKESEHTQVSVNNDFNLDITGENASVLSVDIAFKNQNATAEDKNVWAGGKLCYRIVYLDDNTVKSANYEADFLNSVANENVNAGDKVIARITVADSEYSLSGNVLKTSCAVDVSFLGVDKTTSEAVFSMENVFVKTGDEETQSINAQVKSVIDVFGEYSIGENIDEIICFSSTPALKGYVSDDGRITYTGEVICKACFRFPRGIETRYFNIPFNEEVKADGAAQNGVCYATASIESDKLTITGEGASVTVSIDVNVAVNALTFGKNYYSVCKDVFSTDRPLNVKEDRFECSKFKFQKFLEEKINAGQTFENDVAIKNINNLYSTSLSSAEVTAEDGVAIVSGTISTDVVYTDYDGGIKTIKAEVPFMVRRGMVEANENDTLFFDVTLGVVSARVRRDNEIELNADVYVNLTAFEKDGFEYVSEITEGESYSVNKPAISIYFAEKGDTVWEIGKALRCAPENVKKLNPDLGDVLTGEEKVVIVRNK